MNRLAVVHLDDDATVRDDVRAQLAEPHLPATFAVTSVADPQAFAEACRARPDLALIDVHLGPDAERAGIEAIRSCRQASPETVVIMYSYDLGALRTALAAGADDFIVKGGDRRGLAVRLVSTHALLRSRQAATPGGAAAPAFVGDSMGVVAHRMQRILGSAIRAIYVEGESGTGKEVVVRCLEALLPRGVPLVKVNCAAIAPQLMESELFGHKKGAFTGALADKVGLFEAASGGWMFLDEIATLSATAQAALLRVLENREIIRVGDHERRLVDVRVVSATNAGLDEQVRRGLFRDDLLQRLREARIELKPLRERAAEIPALVDHFCATEDGGPYRITPEARALLAQATWRRGNVRELRNCIRAMTERHVDRLLTPLSVPTWLLETLPHEEGAVAAPAPAGDDEHVRLPLRGEDGRAASFDYLADRLLLALLRRGYARRGAASERDVAAQLGVPRSTLKRRLQHLTETGLVDATEARTWFTRG
jgi:DNA-binding NtrC family response regulator